MESCLGPGNGAEVKIWECFDNLHAQQWFFTGDSRLAVEGSGIPNLTVRFPHSPLTSSKVHAWICPAEAWRTEYSSRLGNVQTTISIRCGPFRLYRRCGLSHSNRQLKYRTKFSTLFTCTLVGTSLRRSFLSVWEGCHIQTQILPQSTAASVRCAQGRTVLVGILGLGA